MLDLKKSINKQLYQDLELCGLIQLLLQISLDLEILLTSTESGMSQKNEFAFLVDMKHKTVRVIPIQVPSACKDELKVKEAEVTAANNMVRMMTNCLFQKTSGMSKGSMKAVSYCGITNSGSIQGNGKG